MRKYKQYPLSDHRDFKSKLISWGAQHDVFINLESNELTGSYNSYECIAAVGVVNSIEIQSEGSAFESLKQFYDESKDWLFGNLAYDLK
ncbi:MAG: aminodeoxychorismate synthase component I, partial [Bacteroidetes bacterium]|nr:aminodeoxychorismate synthase component I [Bacteroidota bacterium]